MDAGRLDQRIRIEAPASAVDALGQDALTWAHVGDVWARVIETQGREFLKGDYQAEEKSAFVIRWMEIDSTMRAVWAGRTWRIVSVTGTFREGYCWLHCIATDGAN